MSKGSGAAGIYGASVAVLAGAVISFAAAGPLADAARRRLSR
jgi:hypothetical protein